MSTLKLNNLEVATGTTITSNSNLALASGKTLTGAAGSIITPGMIIQTISGTFTGTTSKSGTSYSEIDSSLNLSITPKYATSKLLYTGNIMLGAQDDVTASIRINQNGVEVGSGASSGSRKTGHTGVGYYYLSTKSGSGQYYETFSCAIHHLTSSAIGTTSTITVKPEIINSDTSGVSFYINRSMNDADDVWLARYASTFTVQEIAQ